LFGFDQLASPLPIIDRFFSQAFERLSEFLIHFGRAVALEALAFAALGLVDSFSLH
jgi:hypothetical protein